MNIKVLCKQQPDRVPGCSHSNEHCASDAKPNIEHQDKTVCNLDTLFRS